MNLTSIKIMAATPIDGDQLSESLIVELFTKKIATSNNSYILEGATGLDAEGINGRTIWGPLETVDFRDPPVLSPRTIVLLIKLNPNYARGETVSILRDLLYKAISYGPMNLLNLHFMRNTTDLAQTYGSITKLESNPFTDDPEIQITLLCSYPYLRQTTPVVVDTTVVPFSNDGIFSDFASTAHHGLLLTFDFTTDVTSFIFGLDNGSAFYTPRYFKVNESFSAGEVFSISSEYDDRYVKHGHRGIDMFGTPIITYVDIADKIDSLSNEWPVMYPGNNRISFYGVPITIDELSYRPAYWGV